jgi:uncharacterized protein
LSRPYRLTLMGLSVLVLLVIGWAIYGNFAFLLNDFWFTAGLLLLITLSLVDQPHFSKDTNVFINSITAGLSLLLIQGNERNLIYWTFLIIVIYLLVSSYALMFIRSRTLTTESKAIQAISRINRQLGRPEVLFSALFIWGAVRQFTMNSEEFSALLIFWIVFMVLDIPSVASTVEGIFDRTTYEKSDDAIGRIIAVKSNNLFSAQIDDASKVVTGTPVIFSDDTTDKVHSGFIVNVSSLLEATWVDVICFADNEHSPQPTPSRLKPGVVYLNSQGHILDGDFVGLVAAGTMVDLLKFEYEEYSPVQVGELLEIANGSSKIVYQITDALIQTTKLQGADEAKATTGEAVQLGVWNYDDSRFDPYGWVPNCSEMVFKASNLEVEPTIQDGELQIGTVPGSNYPVIMDKETAVTHHLAILGVTGTGKSHFARSLIRSLACDDLKVIVVDLTGEYQTMFPNITKIVNDENSVEAFKAIEALAAENAKFANQRNSNTISTNEQTLKTVFYSSIKTFLEGDETKAIFELPDISNRSNIFEYVRWFFWCLFETSKTKGNFEKRVCVVLEEAHTVVPEYNAMGATDNASKASVNSIAQIALQGRKYNIGLVVIAQRTANVSKTILTQCNSIIAFQEFDKTSTDFLSSYMSQSHLKTLSTLKFRTGIAVGKAFKSTVPMLFEVPYEEESPESLDEERGRD